MASIPVKIILDVDGDKPIEAKIKGQALAGTEGEGTIGYSAGEVNWVDSVGSVKKVSDLTKTNSSSSVSTQWLNSYPPSSTDTGAILGSPIGTTYESIVFNPLTVSDDPGSGLNVKPGSSRIHAVIFLNVTSACTVTIAFFERVLPSPTFTLVSAGSLPSYYPTEYTQTLPVGKHRLEFSRQFDNLVNNQQIEIQIKASATSSANFCVSEIYSVPVGATPLISYANHDV